MVLTMHTMNSQIFGNWESESLKLGQKNRSVVQRDFHLIRTFSII